MNIGERATFLKVTPVKNMSDDEKLNKRFDVVLACRNAEIELFWKRSSYYWVFVAAALVAYGGLGRDNRTFRLLISSFGLMSSLAWLLGNIGSKWWQENWEQKLKEISPEVVGADIFTPRSPESMSKDTWSTPIIRYSVTRLATLLSEFVVILWIAIFLKEIFGLLGIEIANSYVHRLVAVFVFVITVAFLVLMISKARGKDR
jgi:hypothetical protein